MSNLKIIPHVTAKDAANKALEVINIERSGKQLGLLCRFPSANIAMGKYWRFNQVNLIAGLSGHGKSYLLNLLTEDFLDKEELNQDYIHIPICLQFCFEMSAYVELLRSCASDLGISYSSLLSSKFDKESKTYNRLTDEELIKVEAYLRHYENKNILFFEVSSNIKVIYNTVSHYVSLYERRAEEINSKRDASLPKVVFKFIVNIDHTLLIEKLDESSALELMANVGKYAIIIRKEFDAMVNLLGQLNNNIEDPKRLLTHALHFPTKSDIYAQGQLYNACDNVFVIHQPELLKISTYGISKIPTKNLIHFIKLKSRHGKVGSIWLQNNLDNGSIEEIQSNSTQKELLESHEENNDDVIDKI